MKILIPYHDDLVETMRAGLGSKCTVIQSARDVESMIKHGGDADIVASGRVPKEYIDSNKSLRLIQTFGAGVNGINREAVLKRDDLTVCNTHVNSSEVAEYAIALLLAAAKNLAMNDRMMRKGDWTLSWGGPIYNVELRNKTCLIIGLGNVGSEIAKRLRIFDMTIHAVTRSGTSKYAYLADRIICIENIHDAVQNADFVILSLPLTEESEGLVDTQFLNRMKSSSILVNISRGRVVDESALYITLSERKIRGAALDVWWRYPSTEERTSFYPSNLPFQELENVVLSPHRAAYSEKIESQQIQFAIANILRFVRNEPLENIVDMKRGY